MKFLFWAMLMTSVCAFAGEKKEISVESADALAHCADKIADNSYAVRTAYFEVIDQYLKYTMLLDNKKGRFVRNLEITISWNVKTQDNDYNCQLGARTDYMKEP